MSPRLRGSLIALAGTTAWAFTGIFISWLLIHHTIAPLTLAFWRDLFTGVGLAGLLAVFRPAALRLRRSDIPFFLVYGFVGMAVFNACWTFSVQLNGAAVATVLAYSSPAFTVLLARLALGEALTAPKLVAVAVSLAGCALVAGAYDPQVWRVNPLGVLLGLATGAAFAFYNLAGRWSAGRFDSAWTVTTYGFLFAAGALLILQSLPFLTPGSPVAALFSLGPAWDGWLTLGVLALGPTLLGFGLYTRSLRDLPAGVASLIASLEPVLTALIAIPVLGEHMSPVQWLGAALILGAVLLVQWEAWRERSAEPAWAEPAPRAN